MQIGRVFIYSSRKITYKDTDSRETTEIEDAVKAWSETRLGQSELIKREIVDLAEAGLEYLRTKRIRFRESYILKEDPAIDALTEYTVKDDKVSSKIMELLESEIHNLQQQEKASKTGNLKGLKELVLTQIDIHGERGACIRALNHVYKATAPGLYATKEEMLRRSAMTEALERDRLGEMGDFLERIIKEFDMTVGVAAASLHGGVIDAGFDSVDILAADMPRSRAQSSNFAAGTKFAGLRVNTGSVLSQAGASLLQDAAALGKPGARK